MSAFTSLGQPGPSTFSMIQTQGGPSLFSHCLKIIATHDPEAVEKLEHLRTAHGLPQRAGFSYVEPVGSLQSCSCGVEFDNFTFIKNSAVNMKLLDAVCNNLDRGECPHVLALGPIEHNEGWQRYTSTTLLQVAAASGNMQVIKFLRAISIDSLLSTSRTGLMPFHPVVIKSHVFQHVRDEIVALIQTPTSAIRAIERCLKIGRLPESACFGQDMAYIAASLLMTYAIPDRKSARMLISILGMQIPLLHIFVYLVMNKTSGVALQELVVRNLTSYIVDMFQRQQLIMATIVADDHTVVQYLLSKIRNWNRKKQGHGAFGAAVPHRITLRSGKIVHEFVYNELDVAIAFGSTRCKEVLQSHMTPTPNVYRQLSPYNFLIQTTGHFPRNINYLGILKKLSEQGFDANFLDEEFNCSPLVAAVLLRRGIFIKPLVEFGYDINSMYRGKNLVQLLLDGQDATVVQSLEETISKALDEKFRTDQFEMLKTILYQNPIPDRCSLYSAISYDLQDGHILNIMPERVAKYTSDTVDGATDVFANSLHDRFLAVSAFAVLYELGFSTNGSTRKCEEIFHSHMRKVEDFLDDYGDPEFAQEQVSGYKAYLDYMLRVRSQPRSLKSCCRIAIRKSCPGRRLHLFLSTANIPPSLTDYILNPLMLWKRVID